MVSAACRTVIFWSSERKPAHRLGSKEQSKTHRDIILELDYHTGTEVRRWDIGRILNPDRSVIVRSSRKDYGAVDWLHMNSVQFDASDNSIVISGRHVGMVKFDYSSGKLKWVFGPALGYEKSGRTVPNRLCGIKC